MALWRIRSLLFVCLRIDFIWFTYYYYYYLQNKSMCNFHRYSQHSHDKIYDFHHQFANFSMKKKNSYVIIICYTFQLLFFLYI